MRRRFLPPCVPWRPGAVSLAGRSGVLRQRVGRSGLRASRLPPCNRDDVAEHSLACQFLAGAGMRAGAPWMRSSRFLTMAASWPCRGRRGCPGRSSYSPRRRCLDLAFHDRGTGVVIVKGRVQGIAGAGKAHMLARARRHAGRGGHPGGLTYNWMGQRKSAPGLRVTVTWPRLCAVRTAWAEVRRNGVVPGVKLTSFTAHRPPR